jgi:transcriptional regulator with XRE-family HTH domain
MPAVKAPKNADWVKIGERIVALRTEKQMTQRALAKALGTSQSAVARMEKGFQNLTADMLIKLNRALGRDIVTLGSGTVNFRSSAGPSQQRPRRMRRWRSYARRF